MASFGFATAARIIVGRGQSSALPDLAAGLGSRPVLITGSDVHRHDQLVDRIPNLTRHPIVGEPTMEEVRVVVEAARRHRGDLVIGIGGGAVLDAAKIVAALLANPGDVLDYAEVVGAGRSLAEPAVACIAVPTTSGTGSEVTANGVVTSVEHQVKVSLRSPTMLPRVALVDADLTMTCPPSVTAHAGLDALVQCIEPLVSPFANPLTDGFCREGIVHGGRSLKAAWADGGNREARADMAICSLLSGLALANGKLGAAHGLAGALGGLLGAPHGALTAAVMVEVSRANIAALPPGHPAAERYALVGELLTGRRSAEAGLDWFQRTAADLGIQGLASYGLSEDQLDPVAHAAARASSTKGNPVRLPVEKLAAILHASL